jgi:hypothetical protein
VSFPVTSAAASNSRFTFRLSAQERRGVLCLLDYQQ